VGIKTCGVVSTLGKKVMAVTQRFVFLRSTSISDNGVFLSFVWSGVLNITITSYQLRLSKILLTDVRPIFSRLAISDLLSPSANNFLTCFDLIVADLGRPCIFPCFLACSIPAFRPKLHIWTYSAKSHAA